MSFPMPKDAVFVTYNPATLPLVLNKLVRFGAVFVVNPETTQIVVSVRTATAVLGFEEDK